jgi:hypothetical protein
MSNLVGSRLVPERSHRESRGLNISRVRKRTCWRNCIVLAHFVYMDQINRIKRIR